MPPSSLIKTFVVVNPQAAAGRGYRRWPRLADQLFHTIGRFDYDFTNSGGAGTILASRAIAQGYRRLIAVGGDGTLNEVVNGCFHETGELLHPDIVVGGIPLGSGIDFWKGAAWPDEPAAAIKLLTHRKVRRCDVGRVTCRTYDDKPSTRFFLNVGDVGMGGDVVDRARKLPAWGSGGVNYLLGAFGSFWEWRAPTVEIIVDGEVLPPVPILTALIANGPYCGGGMQVAPDARINDGVWSLVIVRDVAKWRVLELLPKLYAGTLARHEAVTVYPAHDIEIRSADAVRVQLDGEVVGVPPVRFQLLPGALGIV